MLARFVYLAGRLKICKRVFVDQPLPDGGMEKLLGTLGGSAGCAVRVPFPKREQPGVCVPWRNVPQELVAPEEFN